MQDKRKRPRMLCSDLVDVEWRDTRGRTRRSVANLEDISQMGACIQLDAPLPLKTTVLISHARGELQGRVQFCVFREVGYFLGVEFEPSCQWSERRFKPRHMLDPSSLFREESVG